MSKHWKPDEDVTSLSLSPAKRRLPPGALPGLLLIAAGCAALAYMLDLAFHPADVFAEASEKNEPPKG